MLDILKASEFKTAKREPLLDFEIYADEAADLRVRITRISENLADKQWMSDKTAAGAMKMARSRAWYAVDLLALSYSAGIETDQMRDFYPIALEYWEDFAKYDTAFDDSYESEGALVPHFELGGMILRWLTEWYALEFCLDTQICCRGLHSCSNTGIHEWMECLNVYWPHLFQVAVLHQVNVHGIFPILKP